MKRTFLTILIITILIFPITTFASSFEIKEADLSIDIDDTEWYVFTRDNIKNNSELEDLGLTYDYMFDQMHTNEVFLNAILFYYGNDEYLELFLRKRDIDDIENLSKYSDEDVLTLTEALAKKQGSSNFSVYKTKYKFMKMEYYQSGFHIMEYSTVFNGNNYTLTFQIESNFSDGEYKEMDSIVDSISFGSFSTSTNDNSSLMPNSLLDEFITGAIVASIVCTVSILISRIKRKKQQKRKSNSSQSHTTQNIPRPPQISDANESYDNGLSIVRQDGCLINEPPKKQQPAPSEAHNIINTLWNTNDVKLVVAECKEAIDFFISKENITRKTDLLTLGLELSMENLAKANQNVQTALGANCITAFIYYRYFLDCTLGIDEDIIHVSEHYTLFQISKHIPSEIHPYMQMMIKIYDLLDRGIVYLYKNMDNISVNYFAKVSEKILAMLNTYKDDDTDWNKINTFLSKKSSNKNAIDKMVSLTIGLPSAFASKGNEEMCIIKNKFTHCDAIIFVEFFIRANILKIAPSKEIAMRFSDEYVKAIISETINCVPDSENFFADMFYNRATLYDSIFMSSEEPIKDIITVLSHIIHEESDTNKYITVKNRNYKYFGGIIENLAIVQELSALCSCIYDCTSSLMKELEEHLKTI